MEHRYLLSQQNICNNHGFDKVVHHFMKKLLKNRTIRKLTSIAIGRRGNSISYIVIDTEQMQTFSLKLEIEKKSIHSVIVWYLFSVIWIRLIKRKKRRNINTKCKKSHYLRFIWHYSILRRHYELQNKFSQLWNTFRSEQNAKSERILVVFPYTNIELAGKVIRKIPCIIPTSKNQTTKNKHIQMVTYISSQLW